MTNAAGPDCPIATEWIGILLLLVASMITGLMRFIAAARAIPDVDASQDAGVCDR
jgi:hypothetical protein